MTFYRPGEEEIKCSSWDALRRHIAECHKEIDFLSDVRDSQAAMIGKFHKYEPIKVTENGIDTWFNLLVKTPAGLVPEDRTACEVRSMAIKYDREWIGESGSLFSSSQASPSYYRGNLRILLADKPAVDPPPTWIPWPWLPDGEYVSHDGLFVSGNGVCMNTTYASKLKGYTSDPTPGRWQVTNVTATYLGE